MELGALLFWRYFLLSNLVKTNVKKSLLGLTFMIIIEDLNLSFIHIRNIKRDTYTCRKQKNSDLYQNFYFARGANV